MGIFQGSWPIPRWLPATLGALSLLLMSVGAQAENETLAGTWSASPMVVSWQVGDWGKQCGPPPSGGGEAGGTVTITQNGIELGISGTGRNWSTAECWERYAGISRVSHSASARSFQSVCKTSPSDPRQAKLVTTVSATDSRISFDETGQYQFVIEGQNCTASVRRSRTYALVARAGEAVPTPSASAAPKATTRAPRKCDNPGLPERLEVRPSRKLMKPGESFEFRTSVLDDQGCALDVPTTWRVISGANLLTITAPGKITTSPEASESEATIEVTLGDRSVRVDVEIASKERYDALLKAKGLDESGESHDAAVLRVASESIGAREVVARDDSPNKTRWFVGLAGACALLLGVLGFLLVRRSSSRVSPVPSPGPSEPRAGVASNAPGMACPTCREEFPAGAEFCPNDGNRLIQQGALSAGPGGSVCPVCGRGFNPGTQTCPEHGEELIPAAAYEARRAQKPPVITKTICPMCGTQQTGEARFCGECGAAVVPIN